MGFIQERKQDFDQLWNRQTEWQDKVLGKATPFLYLGSIGALIYQIYTWDASLPKNPDQNPDTNATPALIIDGSQLPKQ